MVLDFHGNQLTKPRFHDIRPFSGGYAVYASGERFGYFSKSGTIAIRAAFASASSFCEGLAAVERTETSGCTYIDSNGKTVISGTFIDADDFSEGLAGVTVEMDGLKAGYINRKGVFTIPPQFDLGYPFSEGLAVVGTRRRRKFLHGVVDSTGKWVQPPWFSTADARFTEGLCPIWDGKFGFIDRTGTIRIPCRFETVETFNNGLCPASIKIRHKFEEGFINTCGDWAIEPKFDWVEPFEGRLAAVGLRDALGYINATGEFVWEPKE